MRRWPASSGLLTLRAAATNPFPKSTPTFCIIGTSETEIYINNHSGEPFVISTPIAHNRELFERRLSSRKTPSAAASHSGVLRIHTREEGNLALITHRHNNQDEIQSAVSVSFPVSFLVKLNAFVLHARFIKVFVKGEKHVFIN